MATTKEVIIALQEEGFTEDIIKTLMPILAYESRVDGVPYVLTALDSESPSYGLGQANVDTMEPAYWMTFNEYNISLPGQTEQQVKQWRTGKVGTTDPDEEDVRDFTPEQREYVIDYMQTADLKFHAKLLKNMILQKEYESDMEPMEAVQDLYKLTIAKFNLPDKHPESVAFKNKIEAEVEEIYNEPTPQDKLNEDAKLFRSVEQQPDTPPPTNQSELNVPDSGPSEPINPETGFPERKSVADRYNKAFNEMPVGPVTQKIRDEINTPAFPDNNTPKQVLQMLVAAINDKRKKKGMTELDQKNILEKKFGNLVDRDNQFFEESQKIRFPNSSLPVNIEDVLDFLED